MCDFLKQFPSYMIEQARRNETDIGGLERGASEANKNGGPGEGNFS